MVSTALASRFDAHQTVELLNRHGAVDTVCALADVLQAQSLLPHQLRAAQDLAENALQEILHGGEAGDAAELVDGQRQ